MLFEKDGSLTIIKYEKNVKLLQTNIIGFKIRVYGYAKLNINLHQDPNIKYKKTPKLIFKTGAILGLEPNSLPY